MHVSASVDKYHNFHNYSVKIHRAFSLRFILLFSDLPPNIKKYGRSVSKIKH